MKRPWLVTARSNEFEWNGKIGSRFSTEERAVKRAQWFSEVGLWNIQLWYSPVGEPDKQKHLSWR